MRNPHANVSLSIPMIKVRVATTPAEGNKEWEMIANERLLWLLAIGDSKHFYNNNKSFCLSFNLDAT